MELVTARLAIDGSQGQELDEIGFAVEAGDRMKARIFTSDRGPSKVRKARNLSRSSMVRLRTLQQIPLWDGAGTWMGAPGGEHGGRGRHGMGGRRMGDHQGGQPSLMPTSPGGPG